MTAMTVTRPEASPGPADRTGLRVVVVGAGMTAWRFVDRLRSLDPGRSLRITVIGEEPLRPYDRVHLTRCFDGTPPEALELGRPLLWSDPAVTLMTGVAVSGIDLAAGQVVCADGTRVGWDRLVFATGASARVPPIADVGLPGVYVYRSAQDVRGILGRLDRIAADGGPPAAAVIGGGLLGLEAAGAMADRGATVSVLQSPDRLLPAQLDAGAAALLRRLVEARGLHVHLNCRAERIIAGDDGTAAGIRCADGSLVPARLVVIATGVRPRDALAGTIGLQLGPRGGILIDECCRTSLPGVYAIGDVATRDGSLPGLIAPGNAQADVLAEHLTGGSATMDATDDAAQLKFPGIGVASFGDAFGHTEAAVEVVYSDATTNVHHKLVLSDDGRRLLGGMLVGDTSAYPVLHALVGRQLQGDPAGYLLPAGAAADDPPGDLPPDAIVCSCNGVTAGAITGAVREQGCGSLKEVMALTRAGTTCGSCQPLAKKIVDRELAAMGRHVSHGMCEHFDMSRRELLDAVTISGADTFSQILARHGDGGRGCDICKPAIASILAHLVGSHALDPEVAPLQDTNDHVLANMQKDGSYSVVPRVPGGEITPDGLVTIGTIAKDFNLYTKITGAQRIDMFGARLEQLPAIWRRLVDAGFESGHAYGKALRNVKSCVGSSWCRYGLRDSVGMAILLELRFRGIRSPHKLKFGVSGCARECAEARSKDVGVIATEKGWNLYVGGNGGFSPRHGELLAEGLGEDALVTAIDRYVVYYVRTADRLQRTARWIEELDGGIEGLRRVIFEDSLGICDELDAYMRRHVAEYRDEWRETLESPERLREFVSFINAPDASDPDLVYVRERAQHRPATPDERRSPALPAGGRAANR